MTPDELCLAVLDHGYIEVDCERGEAYTLRKYEAGLPKRLGIVNMFGYKVCTLHFNGERKQIKLHRLIWIACHGAIPSEILIDHINRCKTDNRISNLRLADAVLNSSNRRSYEGNGNPACKINAETASAIRKHHEVCKSYSSVAAHFGVSKSLVAQIVRGELW